MVFKKRRELLIELAIYKTQAHCITFDLILKA
jgi:hypothetical protein